MPTSAATIGSSVDVGSRLRASFGRGKDQDADGDLVDACVSREDPAAFATLVERYQSYVFRLALSVLGPGGEADAQDVAQDVFIRLAGHLRDFRGESTFRTWLHRLALNLALDHRRRARRHRSHVVAGILEELCTSDGAGDPFLSAETAERARTVGHCLESLPDGLRSVIHLRYWLDLQVEEIAGLLQVPLGTVKSHLHRGRKLLYGAMQAKGLGLSACPARSRTAPAPSSGLRG